MAAPLSLTVDTASRKRTWHRSFYALLTSLALQGSALFFLGVSPLLNYDGLPEPQFADPLKAYVPVMPAPPPALVKGPRRARPVDSSRLLSDFRPPIMVVCETAFDDFEAFAESPAGVPDGVEGGWSEIPESRPPVPPEDPAPPQPVIVGGEIDEPQKLHHVSPIYPAIATQARIEGTVRLEATIDADGNVTNLRILESIPLLDAAAIAAVRQWKYAPTRLNGRPVPILMMVNVTFTLRR